MDTTFLNCFLALCLFGILILFFVQSLKVNNPNIKNKQNGKLGEQFLPVIFDTCLMQRPRTTGMPVHRVGPVYNFHQYFNKYPNAFAQLTNPTGTPEMGWRNFYLNNYNNSMVDYTDTPFKNIPTRHFLDNLDNVDNIYRKCN